jgi:hypothetical protein
MTVPILYYLSERRKHEQAEPEPLDPPHHSQDHAQPAT